MLALSGAGRKALAGVTFVAMDGRETYRRTARAVSRRRSAASVNVSLAAPGELLAAIATAKSVALCAYVLPPGNAVARALEAAADRGASVSVTLDDSPYFGARWKDAPAPDPNLGSAAALRAHGVTVRLSQPPEPSMHLKAAVIDGRAFLDDRNWATSGHSTIVETRDGEAVAAIADAIAERPRSQSDLALQKSAALALEAATIRGGSGDRVDVVTESFGASDISAALAERARAGATVRLAVDARVLAGDVHGRERAAIARLAASGVEVRALNTAEKFAVAGDRVWLGSANATVGDGAMLDWGIRSADARLGGTLEAAFEVAWSRGLKVAPAQLPKSAAAVAEVRVARSRAVMPSSSPTKAAVSAR